MFTNPIGLLALLAIPAILAIHLFRRRFEPRVVSAVFLWRDHEGVPAAGRTRERLHSTASLWMELAAALLLALALAGFRPFEGGSASHVVVLLDGSFAMNARASGSTLRDRAVEEVRSRLRRLPASSAVTILTSGPTPEVLAGPRAFPAEAIGRLASFAPHAPAHDWDASIALAGRIAEGNPFVAIAREFRPEAFPPACEVVSIGTPLENVALTRAVRTRDRIYVTAEAFTQGPVKAELVLSAGGRPLASMTADLEPGQKRFLSIAIPEGAPALEGVLRAPADSDALDDDSRFLLTPTPVRRIALWSDLDAGTTARLRFGTGAGAAAVDRLLEYLPDTAAAASPEAAHVLFTTSMPSEGASWTVRFAAGAGERADWVGPFLKDKSHPLLEGVTLEGVLWSSDARVRLGGFPIVSAGNTVLLAETRDGQRRVFHWNLDPTRSTLPRSPDWPILLSNLVEMRRAELPGAARTNLAAGDAFVLRAAGDAQFHLTGPAGDRVVRSRGELAVDGALLTHAGLYRVTRLHEDGTTEAPVEFAVNFLDARVSDLRTLAPGTRPVGSEAGATLARSPWFESVLSAAALVFLCLDWFALARSRRHQST